MEGLTDILSVMSAFRDGTLTPTEFVARYSALWRELIKEQDDAIAGNPTVGRTLQELGEQLRYSEITTERYEQMVHEQYALLQGLRLRPDSEASEILDRVYVEADAYRDDADETDSIHLSAEQLADAQ
jgi:hypothetical protein